MDENKEKLLEKIKKLFAMGDSSRNPNEEEVKTALAMATKLMKENNLTLSDVDIVKEKDNIHVCQTKKQGNFHLWEKLLALTVAELFECKVYMHTNLNGISRNKRCQFVGVSSDAELASLCYNYLRYNVRLLAKLMAKDALKFSSGCTDRLCERIQKEIQDRTPEEKTHCTAIICLKNQLIETYVEKNMAVRKTQYSHCKDYTDNSIDYFKGYLAGGTLDINNKQKLE